MDSVSAIILAAGEGKRMKSRHSKVMHKLCGKPMIHHVVHAVKSAGIDNVAVVVGHCAEEIESYFKEQVNYAYQKEQLGTGHAVMCASEYFKGKKGQIIVLTGDTPLITHNTINELIAFHKKNNLSVTVMSAEFDDPTGYGRIVRGEDGSVLKIVEHKDCSSSEINIREINSGIYCFDISSLDSALSNIKNNNAQGEYYLTDALEIIRDKGEKIGAYIVPDNTEIIGINNKYQLSQVEIIMREKVNMQYMLDGVIIVDPKNTYIENGAKIGMDTTIYPGCYIDSGAVIGEECVIGPNTKILQSVVEDETEITYSVVLQSKVGKKTTVGPFAYIRPNSVVGNNVKIGDFVEIKNASIGNKTKVSHLTYIGDADVGKGVNFGCGTVVVNYDGEKKHRSVIEDNAFIGCNTNLVSPVVVREGAYTAAGSTITKEVPSGSLAIARSKQIIKDGWAERKNNKEDK